MACSVTYINHATVLIRLGDLNVLTDPVFSFSVSFFLPRLKPPGIRLHDLPPIDAVIISHNHYDHLNLRSLRKLRRNHAAVFVAPTGVGRYGLRTGFSDVRELDWWEKTQLGGASVTSVPAKHFSGRTPWDRNRSRYAGFVLQAEQRCVYFAGDTAYDGLFRELARRFDIDVALIPIGAYKPHAWFRHIHLNPQTALQAFEECGARHLVPIHWGTFKISDEPMEEPPRWLHEEAERRGLTPRVHILDNGETFSF